MCVHSGNSASTCMLYLKNLTSLNNLNYQAIPVSSRIAQGDVAVDVQHVCMVLVIRPGMEEGHAALGSGSIISTRHVLTAAHLVEGLGNTFRINFFVLTSRRSYNSTFALIHEKYDAEDHINDIALIFLQGDNLFSELNIISISTANAQAGLAGTVTGYGFTSANSGVASDKPISASQSVAVNCNYEDEEYESSPSHFCAVDSTNRSIVCPGDNGKYLLIFMILLFRLQCVSHYV